MRFSGNRFCFIPVDVFSPVIFRRPVLMSFLSSAGTAYRTELTCINFLLLVIRRKFFCLNISRHRHRLSSIFVTIKSFYACVNLIFYSIKKEYYSLLNLPFFCLCKIVNNREKGRKQGNFLICFREKYISRI